MILRCLSVSERLFGTSVRLVPRRRPGVQLRFEFRLVSMELAPQQLAEQPMEPIPLTPFVERHDQQVAVLEASSRAAEPLTSSVASHSAPLMLSRIEARLKKDASSDDNRSSTSSRR